MEIHATEVIPSVMIAVSSAMVGHRPILCGAQYMSYIVMSISPRLAQRAIVTDTVHDVLLWRKSVLLDWLSVHP